MKVLAFQIGAQGFGLALAAVKRVLPAASLVTVPGAPRHVAGLLDLHGLAVPVIDLSSLAGLEAETVRYNTRILLVDYPLADGSTRPLGLRAERVSGVITIAAEQLAASGIAAAPWLGEVATGPGATLQLVSVDALLTPEVRATLYPAPGAGQ